MRNKNNKNVGRLLPVALLWSLLFFPLICGAGDLAQVRQAGELRHIGVRYANFVTGDGQGFDVELVQGFARSLGVKYRFIESDWGSLLGDLLGRQVTRGPDGHASDGEVMEVRGDLIATGLTWLDWRAERVSYSDPTFPTSVWLVTRADFPQKPITPSGDRARDIQSTKALLKGRSVLAMENTCLDPRLYGLESTGARVRLMDGGLNINEIVPRLLGGQADMSLLDVPDALVALDKWPGEINVIGPISPLQEMAAAFDPSATELRAAFNAYLGRIRSDGRYGQLVEKYYPSAPLYFSVFFRGN